MAINKTVNKSTSSHGAMRNCIEYVLKDTKIKDGFVEITGPYEKDTIDYDKVYNAFLAEKRLWGKNFGRMYAHNIISFHYDNPFLCHILLFSIVLYFVAYILHL